MTAGDLKRIDSRPIPDSREEIRAFMVVWNESLRLESMLKHYRQLQSHAFRLICMPPARSATRCIVRAHHCWIHALTLMPLPITWFTNLYSGSSVRFKNSAQLVELELMKTERAYEESAHLTAPARSVQSA